MDTKVEAVLAEYEAREAKERVLMEQLGEAARDRINEFLITIGRNTGSLLNQLIKTNGCKSILEVGTSYGNGAIWLGEAARATGGKLVTLELSQQKVDYARTMARKAGLEDCIEYIVGDAIESIAALPGPFDFVLIDHWKELYIPTFDALYPKLAPGAFVAADNMIYPPWAQEHARAYRVHVHSRPDMGSVLLKTGSGVELSQKTPPL